MQKTYGLNRRRFCGPKRHLLLRARQVFHS